MVTEGIKGWPIAIEAVEKTHSNSFPTLLALPAFYFAKVASGCLAGVVSVSGWLGL